MRIFGMRVKSVTPESKVLFVDRPVLVKGELGVHMAQEIRFHDGKCFLVTDCGLELDASKVQLAGLSEAPICFHCWINTGGNLSLFRRIDKYQKGLAKL